MFFLLNNVKSGYNSETACWLHMYFAGQWHSIGSEAGFEHKPIDYDK